MLSVASSRTCGYDPASFALSCALVTIMSSVASVSCADGLSSVWPVASEGAGPVGQVEDQGDVVQRHDLPPVPSWWLRSWPAIPRVRTWLPARGR